MLGPGISFKDLDVLRDLSYIAGLRGRDGTGIIQGRSWGSRNNPKNKFKVAKSQHEVSYFQWYNKNDNDGDKELFENVQNNFFAVHTRGASRGIISDENAHPFIFENLIGMHNGTLYDTRFFHKTKTDSELLFNEINKRGLVETLTSLNPTSDYALVIYDRKTGEIRFVRNYGRSLYFCFNAERAVMYWSSEKEMLELALRRNRQKIIADEISALSPFKVVSIHPKELPYGKRDVFLVEKFEAPKIVSQAYEGLPWPRRIQNQNFIRNDRKTEILSPRDIAANRRIDTFKCEELKDGEKIPYTKCDNCQKDLSLVDQFFSLTVSGVTTCPECTKDFLKGVVPEKQELKLIEHSKPENENENKDQVG